MSSQKLGLVLCPSFSCPDSGNLGLAQLWVKAAPAPRSSRLSLEAELSRADALIDSDRIRNLERYWLVNPYHAYPLKEGAKFRHYRPSRVPVNFCFKHRWGVC